jgi:hypothetical protein
MGFDHLLPPYARKMQMSRIAKTESKGVGPLQPSQPQPPRSIPRIAETSLTLTVDQACAGDFQYFCEHPDEEQYIRQFVPGEFGAIELPPIPPGFRHATLVSVTPGCRPASRSLPRTDGCVRGYGLEVE